MTISVVRRITGENIQEIEQQSLKIAAYLNENTDATVTVLRNLSGDPNSIHNVAVWDSLAAYEENVQKRAEESEFQALVKDMRKLVSNMEISFHLHVGP